MELCRPAAASSLGFLFPDCWLCSTWVFFFFLQYDGSCWLSSTVGLFCFGVACPDGVVPFLPGKPQGSSQGLVPELLLGTNCP